MKSPETKISIFRTGSHFGRCNLCFLCNGIDVLTSPFRDIMGDMSFSGGFETLASGGDTEGWMQMVAKHFTSGNIFSH